MSVSAKQSLIDKVLFVQEHPIASATLLCIAAIIIWFAIDHNLKK